MACFHSEEIRNIDTSQRILIVALWIYISTSVGEVYFFQNGWGWPVKEVSSFCSKHGLLTSYIFQTLTSSSTNFIFQMQNPFIIAAVQNFTERLREVMPKIRQREEAKCLQNSRMET
jgi:hypothetical protein